MSRHILEDRHCEGAIRLMRTAEHAARLFIGKCYPSCRVAILAGSASEGKDTEYSDLDLVIFEHNEPRPYRRTYNEFGWTIEAFVMDHSSYRKLFMAGIEAALPSLQRMCAEGIVLKDDGTAEGIREEARSDLASGPFPWADEELDMARYRISEDISDLSGSSDREESLFIVQELAAKLVEFVLRANGRWLGEGKWALRMLKQYDAAFSQALTDSLEEFYASNDRKPLLRLADEVLRPFGGRLAEGHIVYAEVDAE